MAALPYAWSCDLRYPALCPSARPIVRRFPWSIPFPPRTRFPPLSPVLFARFVGTTRSSDCSDTCMSAYGWAFADRPAPTKGEEFSEVSRFCARFQACYRVSGLRGVAERLAIDVVHHVAFPSIAQARHADYGDFRSSMAHLACLCPCRTLHPRPHGRRTHDSGSGRFATPFQCGSLIRDSVPVCPGGTTPCPLNPSP